MRAQLRRNCGRTLGIAHKIRELHAQFKNFVHHLKTAHEIAGAITGLFAQFRKCAHNYMRNCARIRFKLRSVYFLQKHLYNHT